MIFKAARRLRMPLLAAVAAIGVGAAAAAPASASDTSNPPTIKCNRSCTATLVPQQRLVIDGIHASNSYLAQASVQESGLVAEHVIKQSPDGLTAFTDVSGTRRLASQYVQALNSGDQYWLFPGVFKLVVKNTYAPSTRQNITVAAGAGSS